jgi:hypothetical protein
MAKYRKKPVVIEAVQWFPNSGIHHPGVWCDHDGVDAERPYVITIHNQRAYLDPGDWILPEPKQGLFYPCKPDIFAATYEDADTPMPSDGALAFLKRTTSNANARIVSSGDLTNLQIAEAQACGRFYVEPGGGLGWALLPFALTTAKDRKREADYFSKHNMMV